MQFLTNEKYNKNDGITKLVETYMSKPKKIT